MKRIIIVLLVLLLALSLAGCRVKEKAVEKMTEKLLEKAGLDADIDGDKMVFKGEDGQVLTIGSDEWPSSDLAKSIPVFKGGKVASVMETGNSLFIMVEEASERDFMAYLAKVKETFSEKTYEMDSESGRIYMAENGEGIAVTLSYEKDAGFSITVVREESEED